MFQIKNILNSTWGWARWLRLIIGTAFIVDAFYKTSGLVGVLGGFLVYQALFNLGCSIGSNSCDSDHLKQKHPNDLTHNFKK